MKINNLFFKKATIWFWAVWWLIALWTDLVGAATHLGYLHAAWAPDLNYPFLAESLKMYSAPEWLIGLFFVGIIVWSLVCTLLFVWAARSTSEKRAIWFKRAEIAFIVSILYWMTFFLADQMVMKFDLEENHMVQGGFLLLTYLGLWLLPE